MNMNKKIDKYDKAIEYAKANSNKKTEAFIKQIQGTYEINAIADAFISEIEKGDKELNLKVNIEIKKIALKEQIKFARMIIDRAEIIMERLDEINLEE